MERGYETSFVGSESSGHPHLPITGDNIPNDVMYSSFSLCSLLSMSQEQTVAHLPELGIRASVVDFPASFTFFSEDFPALNQKSIGESSRNEEQFGSVKVPKIEFMEVNEPFNFITKSPFHHLLDLNSFEQAFDSPSQKRARLDSIANQQTLESLVSPFQFPNCFIPYNPKPDTSIPAPATHRSTAQQRRTKISDKTRCLQKLMPWDKRMDIATMLEEAYKYVKFLQAQVSVLQGMPSKTSFSTSPPPQSSVGHGDGDGDGHGDGDASHRLLRRLTRQQLLYVVLNSPMAQTKLYSQGCCVVSFEQLVLLRKFAENMAIMQQQHMFGPYNVC